MKDTRYYIVKLKHDNDYFPAICKEKRILEDVLADFLQSDIGWALFKTNYVIGKTYQDLLTGKLIYNANNGEEDYLNGKNSGIKRIGLTYRDRDFGNRSLVTPISQEEVVKMLSELTDEQVAEYKIIMNEIETDAIKAYKEDLEWERESSKIDKTIDDLAKRGRR